MALPKRKEVSADEMRSYFNRFIGPRIESGVYHVTRGEPRPAKPHLNLPEGSTSAMYEVRDPQNGDRLLAKCHAYELPDGNYAFGGLDPKYIWTVHGVMYLAAKSG